MMREFSKCASLYILVNHNKQYCLNCTFSLSGRMTNNALETSTKLIRQIQYVQCWVNLIIIHPKKILLMF